ncbi:hypothetical protein V6N13_053874 [Hibiscus sabdariffa]
MFLSIVTVRRTNELKEFTSLVRARLATNGRQWRATDERQQAGDDGGQVRSGRLHRLWVCGMREGEKGKGGRSG